MWQKFLQRLLTHTRLKNKAESRKKLLLKGGLALLAFLTLLISAAASYRYFAKQANNQEIVPPLLDLSQSNNLDPSQISEDDKKSLAVLLLGYGGPGHEGGFLTDVIQVLYFDFELQQLAFISVPRDLQVTLANGESRKINSVMSSGMSGKEPLQQGMALTKAAISQITGIPIKYVIAVDFVGFQRTIGYGLKGIEVEVSQTLDDPWYPIEGEQLNPCGHSAEEVAQITAQYSGFELEKQFACRYERVHVPAGKVTMQGGEALKYVRSRHSSSDFDRSRRQKELLLGIRNKLFSLNALKEVGKYFTALNQYVSTDLTLEIAEYLAPLFVNAQQFETKSIILSTENVLTSQHNSSGASVLVAKNDNGSWQAVQAYIQQNLTQ